MDTGSVLSTVEQRTHNPLRLSLRSSFDSSAAAIGGYLSSFPK